MNDSGNRAPEAAARPNTALMQALQDAANATTHPAQTQELLRAAHDEIKRMQATLASEHLRYRALFDAVPDCVALVAFDGTILDVNEAGLKAYQRPPGEIIGHSLQTLNPGRPRGYMSPIIDALRHGKTYVTDVTNMRADGSHFPAEVHSALFPYDGRNDVLVAVTRDVSLRQQAEARYSDLMDAMDKGIVLQRLDGEILYCNAAGMRILGITSKEHLVEDIRRMKWQLLNENGRPLPEEEWPVSIAMRTGKTVQSTVLGWYSPTRRSLTWLSVTCVPQFTPGSNVSSQVMSIFSDVTTLKRDSAMFSKVQALAHVGGWEWTREDDRLYLTDESRRILRRTPPPATMQELIACLEASDGTRFQQAIQHAVETRSAFDLEVHGLCGLDQPFWIRMIGEPMRDGPAIVRITGTLQDITEHKAQETQLLLQARTDALTGLLNREALTTLLDTLHATTPRRRTSVLYIDLDRFKTVNDALGHAAGDQMLRAATRCIQRAVGTRGSIARFGGDEFLVVCDSEQDDTLPEQLAIDILKTFEEPFAAGDDEFNITASIGIAHSDDAQGNPNTLIQNADLAMYASKRRARNSYRFFTPDMAHQQQEKLQIETQLHRATRAGEFQLVFQPQVALASGRILSAEALVRWSNPRLGEMRPDRFIAHAELSGDIVGIGKWVLHDACRQIAAWRDAGQGIVRVAINVSYRQLTGDNLPALVRAALEAFRLPGSALELEFTERALIEDDADTLRQFAELREMGVILSIDDFGEGYSGLKYLSRLPIHGLKLSGLFVKGVPDKASDVAVCNAVVGIARSLDLTLVAEGVETEAQRRFLLDAGVPMGQGYLFSPGLLPNEFMRHLQHTGKAVHA